MITLNTTIMNTFFRKINALIWLLVIFSFDTYGQGKSTTILSYNTLHGFGGDKSIQDKYVDWVKQIRPDIILYQEMNGFNQQRIHDLALEYGHEHSAILSQDSGHDATHPIAITSRLPISDCELYLDSMWHGYIYAKIGGLHCFVTHLAPFTLQDRRADLNRIVAHAATIPQGENIVIAGDFNALSAVDSAMYGVELLTSMRRIEGRLEPKSGTPIVKYRTIYRNNLNDNEIDYSITGLLKNAGFIDSYYITNSKFKNSVPTKGHAKPSSKLRRIDYIWVNPALADQVYYADIYQDDQTDSISDHYPVFIKFKSE